MYSHIKKIWTVILMLLSLGRGKGESKCPTVCDCAINDDGETTVSCKRGNLVDPLPVLDMPSNAEFLLVIPPEEKPNALTLGPIFKKLQLLKEIRIIHSGIPAIGEHSFWGLRDLIAINVSYNAISSIVAANFKGPEALQFLDLSYNIIESVPSAVFMHLKFLQQLDLSHNRISELVPQLFLGLSQLLKLDLSYNPLGEIPASRLNLLASLTEFKCAGCGLLTFEKELLSKLPNVEVLDLSRNRLTVVPTIKEALTLHRLLLDHNHISKINGLDLNHLPLEHLYISNNRISKIENDSFTNTSLAYVDLSFNEISNLDSRVLEPVIGQLKLIDISGNHLKVSYLKVLLPKARQLRHLSMTQLGISKLPKHIFRRSRQLRYLNLSSNSLSDFPHEVLFSIPYLQTLDLSLNTFKGLTPDLVSAFKAMPSLSSIYLKGNPWQCQECYVSSLVAWMKSAKLPHSLKCIEGASKDECLRCAGPPSLSNFPLIRLKEEQLESCNVINWEPDLEIPGSDESVIEKNSTKDSVNVGAFFKGHVALLVGVGCGLTVALLLVVVVAVACCKKQTALYYTEEEPEKKETLITKENSDSQELKTTPKFDPLKIPAYEPMAISKVLASTNLYRNGLQSGSFGSTLRRNSVIKEEPETYRTSTRDVTTNFYGVED